MIKMKKQKEWIDVLELSDSEFCREIGMDEAQFQAIKSEIEPNSELDFKKRFYSGVIKPEVWK